MGVFEALFFGPDFCGKLAFYEGAYFFERRRLAHSFAAFHDELAQAADCVLGEYVALPRLLRVDEGVGSAEVRRFVLLCDEVGDGPAVGVVDAPELFASGVCDFFKGFRYFDGGAAGLALVDCDELVDRAEDGVAFCGYEALADAEGVYAAALVEYRAYREFVEAVGGDDFAVGEAGFVEQLTRRLREVGEVAGVYADALEPLAHRDEDVVRGLYRVGHAGVEDVVCVDEQDGVVGVELGEAAEGSVFVVVVHDPAVGHRAADGDAEHLSREDGRGAARAAYVGRARAVDGGVDVVRAARAEVRDAASLRGLHDALGFCRDERLVVYLRQYRGLYELRVDERRVDGQDRFVGVHDAAFGHRDDVAAEAVTGEPAQEVFVVYFERAQVFYVAFVEVEVLKIFEHLFEPGEYREAPAVGVPSVEYVECGEVALLVFLEIPVRHRHLVEVHHHGDVARVVLRHVCRLFLYVLCRGPFSS